MKKRYLFRFVPTMRCNFNCSYCFVGDSSKRPKETMFDLHSPDEWIDAMRRFSDCEIEIYMWGGEPFLLDGTYTILKEWLAMDHLLPGCRIDTNIFFADKIAERCPSNKLKLNCSYHMKYHSLEQQYQKIKKLKELDMVGMMNFVASEYNITKLRQDYNMSVLDLINMFGEIGVFVNVAGDFAYTNNENYERYDEYMKFITQFISPEEWNFLRGCTNRRKCEAGKHFFTVNYDGNLTCCIDNKSYGNFFEGIVKPAWWTKTCGTMCQSLISYPWRRDNDFIPWSSLTEYIKRCEAHRKTVESFVDFEF